MFPDIYAKSAKWFRQPRQLFRRRCGTKHWREKPNEFSLAARAIRRPAGWGFSSLDAKLLNGLRRIKASENEWRQGEPKQHPDRLTVQPSACLRVLKTPQQRIAVVGNGNIDVGSESLTRKPGQPAVKNSIGSSERRIDSSLKTGREGTSSGLCGAMSQQGGEFRGNVSAPQKLLHLVGCRDRKVAQGLDRQGLDRQVLETSQYPNRVKR